MMYITGNFNCQCRLICGSLNISGLGVVAGPDILFKELT